MGEAARGDGLMLSHKLRLNHFPGPSSPPGPAGAAAAFHPCPHEATSSPETFPSSIQEMLLPPEPFLPLFSPEPG